MTDTAAAPERELTDGFNLVIEALKMNGVETIYNVPGIPITDLGRMMQAAGMRVISFRHEQNAGFADRKSTRLNSSHIPLSRMPSSA